MRGRSGGRGRRDRARGSHDGGDFSAEDLLGAVVESSPVAISAVDVDDRLLFWCPVSEELYGWRSDEVLGKQPVVVPEDLLEEARALHSRVRSGETILEHATRRRRKDGSVFDAVISLAPLRSPDGEIVGVVRATQDVTERMLRERALRESEERLRLAADVAGIGVWELDLATMHVTGDVRSAAIIADEPGELSATTDEVHARIHPADRERTRRARLDAVEGRVPYDLVFRVVTPSGGIRRVHSSGNVLRDGEGRPVRLVGVLRDVTVELEAREALQHAAERLATLSELDRALLDAATVEDAVSAVLRRIRLMIGTRATVSVFEASARGGAIPVDVLDEDARVTRFELPPGSPVVASLRRGEAFAVTETESAQFPAAIVDARREAGVRSSVSVPVLVEGELLAAINLSSDRPDAPFDEGALDIARETAARIGVGMTRLRAEADLRRLADELEERVAERTRELEQARAAAEQASAAKNDFLSLVSHELRTPLNVILGFAQLLELEERDPERQESVEQILRAGRHLLELISEILDITAIESGRVALSIEPLDAHALVAQALDLIRPLALDSGIELSPPPAGERWVLADRQRLLQVLLNILTNAVKYNRPGGRVEVTGREAGGGLQAVTVRDTGRGMTAEELSRLFDPFERLASAAGTEGTGLGLTVAEALVRAMGGELTAHSVPDQGSTLAVLLPAAGRPAGRAEGVSATG